ncbi:MAG: hypothetical protein EOP82_10765 [Variovorax sp.]|nr:MAG: hypothetical protein EOP82_10765 [Variovorax sp.]
MNAEQHRLKAERIERSLQSLGSGDREMRIEAAMLAGTHWANYALHRRHVTTDAEDIVHTSMLTVNMLRKYSIVEAGLLQALAEIEELRPLHVRGDAPGGDDAATRALQLLVLIGERARQP